MGTCVYPLPAVPAGEHHVDLLSIPAGTDLDLEQFSDFYYYVMMELSHAHISITVAGTEVACGDFHLNQ